MANGGGGCGPGGGGAGGRPRSGGCQNTRRPAEGRAGFLRRARAPRPATPYHRPLLPPPLRRTLGGSLGPAGLALGRRPRSPPSWQTSLPAGALGVEPPGKTRCAPTRGLCGVSLCGERAGEGENASGPSLLRSLFCWGGENTRFQSVFDLFLTHLPPAFPPFPARRSPFVLFPSGAGIFHPGEHLSQGVGASWHFRALKTGKKAGSGCESALSRCSTAGGVPTAHCAIARPGNALP